MREDGMRLSPSPQPGQVEMHADDAKIDAADAHLGHHRAARLQRGQVDDFLMDDLDRLSGQQRVAMPAEAAASRLEGHGLVVRSEERRVGKACVRTVRSRWSAYHIKNN